MVDTFQALGLLLTVVLPGAVFTFSYEHRVGPFAGETNDRFLRFIIGTALVFPFTAMLSALAYEHVLHVPVTGSSGEFRNRLMEEPTGVSPLWTLVPVLYVAIPWGLGRIAGEWRIRRWRRHVAKPVEREQVEPQKTGSAGLRRRLLRSVAATKRTTSLPPGLTAWDAVFFEAERKLIAVKLRSGTWVAGFFGDYSFASPPAVKEKEVLLEHGFVVDETGVIERDEKRLPIKRPGAVVVKYGDVELMVVEPAEPD